MEQETIKTPDMVIGWLESQLGQGLTDKDYGTAMIGCINMLKETIDKNTDLQIEYDRMDDTIREQAYQDLESYYKDQKNNQCLTDQQRHLVLKVIEECQKIIIAPTEVRKGETHHGVHS